jgi:hypothetical protein
MIRGAILAAGLLAAGATTASSAEITFVGSIKILTATAQCQGPHAGNIDSSHFHPYLAGNAQQTDHSEGITTVYNYGGWGVNLANHVFDTTARVATDSGLGWGGTYTNPSSIVKLTLRSPATITNATQFVLLQGQITRPNGDGGGLACVTTFEAAYVRDNN